MKKIILYFVSKSSLDEYLSSEIEDTSKILMPKIVLFELNYEKYAVETFILYPWKEKWFKKGLWVNFLWYEDEAELERVLTDLNSKYDIFVFDAMWDSQINNMLFAKKFLWKEYSSYPEAYKSKLVQRKIINEKHPELWIKFMYSELEELNLKNILEKIPYPFIIKPIDWVESSLTMKIESESDFDSYIDLYKKSYEKLSKRGFSLWKVLVEEFIDGEMYSIDYFVDKNWKISYTKAVEVVLWVDIWINDYANVARLLTEQTENKLDEKKLKDFIVSSVESLWIKNSFVHHEFKFTSKKLFKSIELNMRIWWWRLEIYNEAYWINMYNMPFEEDFEPWNIIKNSIWVNIYSTKRWILEWFNDILLNKIKELPWVYKIALKQNFIWKEVWLTKDWFVKLGSIFLTSNNYDEIISSYNFITDNYSELIILE